MLPWEIAPADYEALFLDKVRDTAAALSDLSPPEPALVRSPTSGYRVRAEFRIWHDGDDLNYVMYDPSNPRVPVPISVFPQALQPIGELMPRLRERLAATPVLRRKLFQVEFMGSTTGELLVSLIYHRRLEDDWRDEAERLAKSLSIAIVGRSRKQKCVIGRDYITDEFSVDDRLYRYRQYEQSFVQPNAPVNAQMLAWAAQQTSDSRRSDLLELYCGNGNFTLPLSRNFRRVLATELSKSGTRAALENIRANEIDNIEVVRLSAEEVSEALAGKREFRRLATLASPLTSYQLDTVFVDPPRAGLDPGALSCVAGFQRIVYVSCNPVTLRANLIALNDSHRIESLAFFDQFPYTPHLESGVVLSRRE